MELPLKKARQYEAEQGYTITDRPGYHLTPRIGWMNDPNGFSVYRGEYHLFYQYNPYDVHWGPMHWGHAISRDLLHWEYLPAAMAPDKEYEIENGCFSGSAIELPGGQQLLMYTASQTQSAERQAQCIALGDGLNYEKYADNPVLTGDALPEGYHQKDFRDPKIWEENGTYYCVIAAQSPDGDGAVVLYESSDCRHWQFVTVLEEGCEGDLGPMWECPDFFPLGGKHILMTNFTNMAEKPFSYAEGSNAVVLVGDYDRAGKQFARDSIQLMDWGLDFYAPQTLLAPDGRRIVIGWMQNWGTCIPLPGAKWFGQMTLPRELSLRNGKLIQQPVREIETCRGVATEYEDVALCGGTVLPGIKGRLLDMTVTVQPGQYESFRVIMAANRQSGLKLTYRPVESTLTLDRSECVHGAAEPHTRLCRVTHQGGAVKLRILLDRYSAEIFVNNGEQVLSCVFFNPEDADGIRFESEGNARFHVTAYPLVF